MQFVLLSLGLFTSVSGSCMKPGGGGGGAAHTAAAAPQDNNCFALSSVACIQKKGRGEKKKVFRPHRVVFGFPAREKSEDLDGGGEKTRC